MPYLATWEPVESPRPEWRLRLRLGLGRQPWPEAARQAVGRESRDRLQPGETQAEDGATRTARTAGKETATETEMGTGAEAGRTAGQTGKSLFLPRRAPTRRSARRGPCPSG